jgi:ribosomal protein S18 acetylase RimI-like enzyme
MEVDAVLRRIGKGGGGVEPRLARHLREWLGQWPAPGPGLYVVGSPGRERPGWDGRVHPVIGVSTAESSVLSVPPRHLDAARALADGSPDRLLAGLPGVIGRPGAMVYRGVFRWSVEPVPLPDAGVWVPADDPVVPDWLRVFGGEVLLALDPESGDYLAGVGIKRHDRYGQELSVGTMPEAQGRGLARRLVAQAARRIVDGGAVATYLHDPANLASARVAGAAGFPDRGWAVLGLAG